MGLVDRDDGWRIPDWLWKRRKPLLPDRPPHPQGCHNPRVPDRVQPRVAGLDDPAPRPPPRNVLVEEGREPPRPAPTCQRPDRLQEGPRRNPRSRPTGVGPWHPPRALKSTEGIQQPSGSRYSPMDMYVIGFTARNPSLRHHRKRSACRVGRRKEAGLSPAARAPVIKARMSSSVSATAYAAGKKVRVVAYAVIRPSRSATVSYSACRMSTPSRRSRQGS